MSYYGSNPIIDQLQEKVDNATSTRDELYDSKSTIDDALSELDTFIEDLESLISGLSDMPELDVRVEVDISFDSTD